MSDRVLIFGIPVDAGYQDLFCRVWGDLRTWIEHGPKDLLPHDRAHNEFVNALADELRRQGVPHPMIEAWNRVGFPDPKEFNKKIKPGQPLGDLSQEAIINACMPLVLSRLKHYRAAGNGDAKSAALVGLLNARAEYDPAEDTSVGYFAKIYRHIDDAIKYEIRGKDGDAWGQKKVDGDADVTVAGKESDDAPEGDGSLWGIIPNTYLPDQIANGLDRAKDDQSRLHHSRIPFWVQAWSDQTHVRCEFGAREEDWMDLPAAPQEMADALAKISPDKTARSFAELNEREQEIVTARFYRKPPILLSEIARGALNPKSKTSYKAVLNIAYRAVVKIAGDFEVKRPIRRPERQPDPPRQVPFKPWQPLTPLQALQRWLLWYEIYLGIPPKGEQEGSRRDRIRQTVHDSRYYPPWIDAYPDLDTARWRTIPTRLGQLGWYAGGLMGRSRRKIEGRFVIIEPEIVIVHRGWWSWNIFDFSNADDSTFRTLFEPDRSAFMADYWRKIFSAFPNLISFKSTSIK